MGSLENRKNSQTEESRLPIQSPGDFEKRLQHVGHGNARAARSYLDAVFCKLKKHGSELPAETLEEYAAIYIKYGWNEHADLIRALNPSDPPVAAAAEDSKIDLDSATLPIVELPIEDPVWREFLVKYQESIAAEQESIAAKPDIVVLLEDLKTICGTANEGQHGRQMLCQAIESALINSETVKPIDAFNALIQVKEKLQTLGIVLTPEELSALAEKLPKPSLGTAMIFTRMSDDTTQLEDNFKPYWQARMEARERGTLPIAPAELEGVDLELREELKLGMIVIEDHVNSYQEKAILDNNKKDAAPLPARDLHRLYQPVKDLLLALKQYTEVVRPLIEEVEDSVVNSESHKKWPDAIDWQAPYLRSLDFSFYTPLARALLGVAVGLDCLGLKEAAQAANSLCQEVGLEVPRSWFLGKWTTQRHIRPIGPLESYVHGFRDMFLYVVDMGISIPQLLGSVLKQGLGIGGHVSFDGRFDQRIDEGNF